MTVKGSQLPAHAQKLDEVFTEDELALGRLQNDDFPDNTGREVRQGLVRLKPIHLKVIELHLRGYNHTEIADLAQVSSALVHYTLKDPLAQPYLIRHREMSEMEFASLRRKANNAVARGLNSKDERTGLQAAKLFYKVEGDLDKKPDRGTTAEDVVAQIINQVSVHLNITAPQPKVVGERHIQIGQTNQSEPGE